MDTYDVRLHGWSYEGQGRGSMSGFHSLVVDLSNVRGRPVSSLQYNNPFLERPRHKILKFRPKVGYVMPFDIDTPRICICAINLEPNEWLEGFRA